MSEHPQEVVEDDTGSYESGLPGFLGTIDEWIANKKSKNNQKPCKQHEKKNRAV